MKYFKEKMTYFQFIKYLVPSVMTMIFLSFYTTIDGFFVSKYAGSDALAGIILQFRLPVLPSESLLCWPPAPVPS